MENTLTMVSPFRLSSLLRHQMDPRLALELFLNPNPNSNRKPFRYTLLSYDLIITKLGRAKMLDELDTVLDKLKLETRFAPKEIIFCNVIAYYSRGRLPSKARQVFDEIPSFRCERTVKSFNSLLNGLLVCHEFDKMWDLFLGADRFACPDACTYNIMINACCLCNDLEGACKLFDEMRDRGAGPNAATFGTLISALCKMSRLEEAFSLKSEMARAYKLEPDVYVYSSLIKGLCEAGELGLAFDLKDEMLRNKLRPDSAIYTTLINWLFKAGRKDEVNGVLEEMKQNDCKPHAATFNAMIAGFCRDTEFDLALKCLDEMVEGGFKPNIITYNTLLSGYCKEGMLKDAIDLFEDMPRQGCKRDVVSYRIFLDGLVRGMEFNEAALVLDEMIFNGYAPHSDSANKFIVSLCEKGDLNLLYSILNSLLKVNVVDINSWMTAVSAVMQRDKLEAMCESVGAVAV